MGMFEPKATNQRLAIQQVGPAVTPEMLSIAHRAGEMAAAVFYRQAERLLSVADPRYIVISEPGALLVRSFEPEVGRQLSELQMLAGKAYRQAAARALGIDPSGLATHSQ